MGDGSRDAKVGLADPTDPADPAVGAYPTVVPTFDPLQVAEASAFRERMPTITDEWALEQARLRSFRSSAPPRPPGPIVQDPALDGAEQVAVLRARFAPLTRVPVLRKALADLGRLIEDPKTAYVLGFVDGILPLDTILEVAGLPEIEILRVFDWMVSLSLVSFRTPR